MGQPIATLRLAVSDDLPAILEIEVQSFIHAGERFEARRIKNLISNPRMRVFVADPGQHAIGWAAGFVWRRGATPWGRVYAIAVHPHARGQRLGPRLLDRLMAALRQEGAERIFLEVARDNHPAVSLYHKSGFTTCAQLPNYYGPGRPAYRMVWPAAGLPGEATPPSHAASP